MMTRGGGFALYPPARHVIICDAPGESLRDASVGSRSSITSLRDLRSHRFAMLSMLPSQILEFSKSNRYFDALAGRRNYQECLARFRSPQSLKQIVQFVHFLHSFEKKNCRVLIEEQMGVVYQLTLIKRSFALARFVHVGIWMG